MIATVIEILRVKKTQGWKRYIPFIMTQFILYLIAPNSLTSLIILLVYATVILASLVWPYNSQHNYEMPLKNRQYMNRDFLVPAPTPWLNVLASHFLPVRSGGRSFANMDWPDKRIADS